ncbi:MAG: hypothetical protein JWP37_2213 [Mucilaginibacter sp.]|nr:hypothetical protein [Mucilaginibacter sp.]
MALPHPGQFLLLLSKFLVLLTWLSLQSCSRSKMVYTSRCDDGKEFKHIKFKQLMDSLATYDQRYVEISGVYEEDKGLSALVNDSLMVDHSSKNALWVDFSQDCPLYLSGTHTGLFEYSDGGFTMMKDKAITIRGKIDLHNKGHLKQYKGAIERVSFIKL